MCKKTKQKLQHRVLTRWERFRQRGLLSKNEGLKGLNEAEKRSTAARERVNKTRSEYWTGKGKLIATLVAERIVNGDERQRSLFLFSDVLDMQKSLQNKGWNVFLKESRESSECSCRLKFIPAHCTFTKRIGNEVCYFFMQTILSYLTDSPVCIYNQEIACCFLHSENPSVVFIILQFGERSPSLCRP